MAARNDLLSTGQAARLLSVTADAVLKWIKQGRIPAARTAGGHYRIAVEHLEHLLPEQAAAAPATRASGLVYCWEYYAEGDAVNERCEECVVYRARALHCYEMSALPPEAGFAGTYCKTSCEDCPYYQELASQPRRVLVVTDSVRLRERLQREERTSNLKLEFASCEYECSTIVHSFKPEYVVIDCMLPPHTCSGLWSHLATDPRVPGVQIVLAESDSGGRIDLLRDADCRQLPRTFSLAELERRIARPSRPRKEVSLTTTRK